MKKINLYLAFTLFVSLNSIAQFNNNNRNNPNRDIPQNNERSQEEIEKEKIEALNHLITNLTNDLNLNELQAIAIKQIYSESFKKQGIIMKKEQSDEDKMASIKSLVESTEKKVLELFDSTQKEKFEELKNKKEKDYKKEKKGKKSK